MQIEGNRELLDTKTDSTLSACVYPYWHPEGKYIAYSVNRTTQSFHTAKVERIEVMDMASDILVYQPETHELLLSPLLQKKKFLKPSPHSRQMERNCISARQRVNRCPRNTMRYAIAFAA